MKKLFKGLIIFILVVVVVVVGVVLTVANLTPNQINIGDIEIYEGNTLNELGLGDTKFKEVYYLVKDISNVDETKIVTNSYDEEVEETKVEATLEESNIPKTTTGDPDYVSLVTTEIVYDNHYLMEYNDTSLAYIFDSIIGQWSASTDSTNADIEALKDLNAKIEEFTINKTTDNSEMRLVLSVDITSMKDQIKTALGAVANYINLPDRIFIVSYNKISANTEGVITTTSVSIKINDSDNEVSQIIFKELAKSINNSSESSDTELINDTIGGAFSTIISNLGKVGTGTVGTDKIVTGITYGPSGIYQSKLTLITNVTE